MKRWIKTSGWLFLWMCVSAVNADTFKHRQTGESFNGFATQKAAGNKTLVYNDDEGQMTPVVLSDYDIVYNSKGRRDIVYLLELSSPEIFLSEAVSKKAAESIIDASNKGPLAIIIQVDNPGGRGDYMKTVTDAILQTKNCPVAAYVSGGTYGGAYSVAAVVAMSCEKVYINPTAGIGAVGPVTGGYLSNGNYSNFLHMYSSDTLLAYSHYINIIAQHRNSPDLLLRALLDKRLSIIEVVNSADKKAGSTEFITKDNRQPTQTLVRTLTEGMTVPQDSDELSPGDVVGKVLNLTAKDAVELGLADTYAESVSGVLAAMQIADAKISPVGGIDNMVKKYVAAKRNISESLSRIDVYEDTVNSLSEQFTTIDRQLQTQTQTREISRGTGMGGYTSSRTRQGFPSNYDYYYGNEYNANRINRMNRGDRLPRSQTITTEEPMVNIQVLYNQLTSSLVDLIAEYRKVLNLTKRWPGGLPPEMTLTVLQNNMDSASLELDKLRRYNPVYPNQTQSLFPQQSRRNRTR